MLFAALPFTSIFAQDKSEATPTKQPSVVHVESGRSFSIGNGQMTITHVGRHQHYNGRDTASYDVDIHSPKSVSYNPAGNKYYVNSLEGFKTVVYDADTHRKLATVKHTYGKGDSLLWAKPSGFYQFNHEFSRPLNEFSGKPVESTFTHDGRYLWVPYYRRSYDINAQEPSAIGVIDTQTDKIIRVLETGALPKMVVSSPDRKWVAVAHWGENTVALIDASSPLPQHWHHEKCFVIDHRLKLDYSLTVPVNRDVNSGYCLRGSAFTPDSRYLLVGCMGGSGGIAVIDVQKMQYLGRVTGMKSNVRHLLIHDGWLYLSINKDGAVQRIRLDQFIGSLSQMEGHHMRLEGWETCKVHAGARTISISPDGRYIFAACNSSSCLAVVDTQSFSMIGSVPVDSYPVGLDISADGKTLVVTSQGRNDRGGNAVNIYHVEYR